ncbi:amino acid ABC transporter permease [Actinomycetaceae bacterium WB03_NA08]|uniref:Amino acid ABC transporter permease n=1 Tax=Scrofimicrobium canadense TaxID=2652290 RepID=A0A6N7W7I4_9ACTO|nr:amino acid ABC transporter permease [Scrofimicrobium canadense]MSS85215.1 amino acid ABC transporter permease [Scrofimicrobium canadense]
MTATVLFDAPGPKAQRRIRVLTVLSSVAIVALIAYAIYLFGANGQLAPDKWDEFTQWPIIRFLLGGLGHTLLAASVAAAIALPLGLLLALARLSTLKPLHWLGVTLVEFFRSIPLLLLIYIFFIALPKYGINPDLFWKLVIPIGLCSGATIAEVFRAGVLALPKGQSEAAEAIGMTRAQTFRYVVFPQAVRLVLPSLLAQVVILLKDTTLGYVVSYSELQFSAKVLVSSTGNLIQTYLVVTVVYILVNLAISRTAELWSRRQERRYLKAGQGLPLEATTQ